MSQVRGYRCLFSSVPNPRSSKVVKKATRSSRISTPWRLQGPKGLNLHTLLPRITHQKSSRILMDFQQLQRKQTTLNGSGSFSTSQDHTGGLFIKFEPGAYEEISRWPESLLEPYSDACKILSDGENTLNQVAPQSDFKVTKGKRNVYTYKGDPGTSLPLLPKLHILGLTCFQATLSTATTVSTVLPTHTITKPYSAIRSLCEPACFRARRNSLLRRRSLGRIV